MKARIALAFLFLAGLGAVGQELAPPAADAVPAAEAAPATARPALLAAIHPMMGVVIVPTPRLYTNSGASLLASDVSIVANTLGLAFSLRLATSFFLEPSLEFYTGYHLWAEAPYDASGLLLAPRALPVELSDRETYTLALLLDLPAVLRIPLGARFSLALGLGPAFHLRFGFRGAKDAPEANLAAINDFFWAGGRFFVPSTTLRGEYRLTDRLEFGFAARAFWPVFNLWNGSPSFLDEGIFGGALVVRWLLE